MDAILITTTFLLGLVLGLAALIHFARHDSFAGPRTRNDQRDELGARSFHERAA